MFVINLHGKDSIYEQIETQILKFINAGILKPDDKLPSVRELSVQLGINPNTVQRAYQKLEEDGFIYVLSKKGAFVSAKKGVEEAKILDNLKLEIGHYKKIGIKKDSIIKLIDEIYKGDGEC